MEPNRTNGDIRWITWAVSLWNPRFCFVVGEALPKQQPLKNIPVVIITETKTKTPESLRKLRMRELDG